MKAERVMFIGSKELGLKTLYTMYNLAPEKLASCVTINDSQDSRSRLNEYIEFCEVKEIKLNILYKQKELREIILNEKPDICFVAGWYYLLDDDVLEMVPGGFIGVHNSLLPRYRGFSPLVWAMINDEEMTGFSVFSFTKEMDEGEIWYSQTISIGRNDYIGDMLQKFENEVEKAFGIIYRDILNGRMTPKKQQDITPSYGAKRIPNDGRINWTWNAEKIYNFIRAQSKPYPGAFTFLDGKKITIWESSISATLYYGTPGQVAFVDKYHAKIICGDNTTIIVKDADMDNVKYEMNEIFKSMNDRLS